ncbi:lysophospholipid acyltransferase family protein [Actinomadura sp. WAC 06369]|uniref:lysophospholipid acyltransferase family protein n=1 Tax=Actinomadura sp. WAC 06369 TaxID=2203193 RepID=UPI000F7B163D|nr:lysophospholipid acyltransferase family protein [Actinomadura sp. WAC 06369]RSN48781.1 1-acyl-sn-glycerol-3-phosphate acyltransferase [Actinomadura sp. WAC 06369]
MLWFWILLRIVLSPIMYVLWRPRNQGMRNVPKRGPALMVSNHLSFADHFFAPLPLMRPIFFIGKGEYFTGKGIKGLISKAFFTGVGVVPVDRTGGSAAEAALETGLRILREGKLLGIYPEGTRAPDNRLYRGKTGVARLALKSRVPVIPVAMINTFELMPSGKPLPRLGVRPGVRFGEPLDFSRYYGREDDREVLRAITDEIMRAIRELSGQEYVDRYAAEVKAEMAGKPVRPVRDDDEDEDAPGTGGDNGTEDGTGNGTEDGSAARRARDGDGGPTDGA